MQLVYILLLIYVCLMNLIAFIVCGIDKWKAIHHRWRISEACLLTLSVIGGSLGMILGMYLFRHKTKHPKFYMGVPVILMCQATLVIYLLR